eukprot:TRINITY_DN4279_c1_g1_i1.p1 TRINITY_DN4279_c1_g1~~TRINITY_DN4279_c1_g1_i1.p1  ORF type:complete len:615 (+),score=180.93 TRINITY_DN4279_c1_g1_i1:255-2099(+)
MGEVDGMLDGPDVDFDAVSKRLERLYKSLDALQSFPEFQDKKRKVDEYSNKLERMLVPTLVEAMLQRDLEKSMTLVGVFSSIHRTDQLLSEYVLARRQIVVDLWQGGPVHDMSTASLSGSEMEIGREALRRSKAFVEWLPSFFRGFLSFLKQEVAWYRKGIFSPQNSPIIDLIVMIVEGMKPSMNEWVVRVVDCMHLPELFEEFTQFYDNLNEVINGWMGETHDMRNRTRVENALVIPFARRLETLNAEEESTFAGKIRGMDLSSNDQLSIRLQGVFSGIKEAVLRSFVLSEGFFVPPLVKSLVSVGLSTYLERVFSLVSKDDTNSLDAAIQVYLHILDIGGMVDSLVGEIDIIWKSEWRGATSMSSVGVIVRNFMAKQAPSGQKTLFESVQRLEGVGFREIVDGIAISALSRAESRARTAVMQCMASPIRKMLDSYRLPKRSSASGASEDEKSLQEHVDLDLPTFSLHPSDVITSVGDHMLSLPEQLEELATAENGSVDAHALLADMCKQVVGLFIQSIQSIAKEKEKGDDISRIGCQQAAEDAGYLQNILTYMSGDTHEDLQELQVIMQARKPDELENAVGRVKHLERAIANALAAIVRKAWNPTPPSGASK